MMWLTVDMMHVLGESSPHRCSRRVRPLITRASRLASLSLGRPSFPLWNGAKKPSSAKKIRVVVAVVRAGVDILRVLGNELLNLKVIERGQLKRSRHHTVGFLRSRSRLAPPDRVRSTS